MNKFNVDITTLYGAGCGGGCYGSQASTLLQVEDNVATTLRALLAEVSDVDERFGTKCIDKWHLLSAIEAGHCELQPIYDDLIAKGRDMMIRYWLIEADDDCAEEALEPSFDEDVKAGIYIPPFPIEAAADGTTSEDGDECDGYNPLWDANKDDYLSWVESHIEEDPCFVADRKRVDISTIVSGEDDEDIDFIIYEI